MEDPLLDETYAHLYNSVPTDPPSTSGAVIEETLMNKIAITALPREPPARMNLLQKNRPQTTMSTNTIFSRMAVPYDIAHRQRGSPPKSRVPDLPPSVEPNLVTIHRSRGKFWVSQRRREAQELTDRLKELERAAESEADGVDSSFESETLHLERRFQAHEDTLRQFTELADEQAPERGRIFHRILDFYRRLSDEIPRLKHDFAEKFRTTEANAAEAARLKQELKDAWNASLASIERQNRTIEALKQQINEWRVRCSQAESQLRDAANDKGAMARASQTNQLRLIELNHEIKEKREELTKINALITTLRCDYNRRNEAIQKAQDDLTALGKQGEKLDRKRTKYLSLISEKQKTCENLRKTPLRKTLTSGRMVVSIQCNRLPKTDATQKPSGVGGGHSEIREKDQFEQIKSDMELVQQELQSESGNIIIRTVEDLKKTRALILQNNQMFDFNVNSINAVHRGDFNLENCPEDEARIYAHWVMRRVMRNTLTSRKMVSTEVQTIELDPIKQGEDSDSDDSRRQNSMFRTAPKALYYLIRQSRFIRLLGGTDFSSRTPKPFDWVIRMIRSIFDEKTVDDRTNERGNLPIMPLPEYILIWSKREWSSDVGDLAIKGCWDVFISAHHHMQKYLEVTLFVRFLDEMWTTEQLSFFLDCRTWGLQRCVSIPMDHEELSEYFTDTYMTKGQVDEFFHFFFANTEQELVDDLTIRGCSCVDPLRGDENEAACIPLQRVLELAVGEKIDETVRRLRKMVAFYKPVPRMTSKRFTLFVKTLIQNVDSNSADSLYRSSLAPNTLRVEMNADEFAEFYTSDRPVLPFEWKSESVTSDQFAPYSTIYSMVLSRWQKFLPFFSRMIDVISKQSYEEAKIMTNEIRHQKYQLLEAKVAFDGVLFFQAYHRVLQTVLRSCFKMNYPEAFLFTRQIGDLVDLLTKKYEKVCDEDEDAEIAGSPEKKKKEEDEGAPLSPPPPTVPEPATRDAQKRSEEEEDEEAVDELADDELPGEEEDPEPAEATDDYVPRGHMNW